MSCLILKKLKNELIAALELQQYHGLLNLDARIKQQVENVMKSINEGEPSSQVKAQLKKELFEIMAIYQQVVDKCQVRSAELKEECIGLQLSKKKADSYLDVAGRY